MNTLGGRYVCATCGSEMLVTRPGEGELACCGRPMEGQGRAAAAANTPEAKS